MRKRILISLMSLCLWACSGLARADSYTEALKEAAAAVGDGDFALAKTKFEEAFQAGNTDTEKALALAKQAHMLAYKQKQYAEAMRLVAEAEGFKDIKPVAEVTLIQSKAKCLMATEAYEQAKAPLQRGLELSDVDWAKPALYLSLGDCYRFTAEPEKALEAYAKVTALDNAGDAVVAVAHLNLGLTYQYSLRRMSEAEAAYQMAVKYNPAFASQVSNHLSK